MAPRNDIDPASPQALIEKAKETAADAKSKWLPNFFETPFWRSIFRHKVDDTPRNRSLAVLSNVFLHLQPAKLNRDAVRYAFCWGMGGITFYLFVILTFTGVALMFYYHPTKADAFRDMLFIKNDVPFGNLLRNLHRWAAHTMIITTWLHQMRVFMTGSYKPPREFNWNVGVILLLVTMMLSFTGYLLPDDQLGFWAVTVGTNMARATPFLGHEGPGIELVQEAGRLIGIDTKVTAYNDVRFALLGGSIVDSNALLRAYIWHCVALPVIGSIFMIVHFWRIRKDGSLSGPAPVMLGSEAGKAKGEALMAFDWHQLWEETSKADNVPILVMTGAVGYYLWYGFREAVRHDRLVEQLEADPALAKTHHRKPYPFHPAWDKVVHTWPYLLRVEFLAALIVTAALVLWAVTLDAPLEPIANPSLTTNPAKAPWYFLGLQELLVYFDPWIAGVILPHIVLGGLMAIPYIDVNPLGNGYYTWRQRKFAISMYMFGFLVLWVLLAIIGTFIRGPGWMWFWPGMTWDAHRQVHEVNQHLHELVGLTSQPAIGIFGAIVTLGGIGAAMGFVDYLMRKRMPAAFLRQNLIQHLITVHLVVLMATVPLKIVLKLAFNIKYVWVTPWFNV